MLPRLLLLFVIFFVIFLGSLRVSDIHELEGLAQVRFYALIRLQISFPAL